MKPGPKAIDLTDNEYGDWIVIKRADNQNKMTMWLCRCKCGREESVIGRNLKNGDSTKCKTCCYKERKPHLSVGKITGEVMHRIKKSAKRKTRTIPFNLTFEYLDNLFNNQNGKCALTGIELTIPKNRVKGTASLDRINSDLGYEEGNVQWVHKHINFMKQRYSQEYFIEMCTLVSQFSGNREDLLDKLKKKPKLLFEANGHLIYEDGTEKDMFPGCLSIRQRQIWLDQLNLVDDC